MSTKFVKVPKIWCEYLVKADADAATYRVALYLLDRATFRRRRAAWQPSPGKSGGQPLGGNGAP
jgi:hypothetical protein